MTFPHSIEDIRAALASKCPHPRVIYGKQHSLLLKKKRPDSHASSPLFLHAFNRILAFDAPGRTLRVQAGVTINQINDFLGKHGFSLATYPEFFDITAGACVATPVHGYSTRHQCLASLVTEVRFMTMDTQEIRQVRRGESQWASVFFGRTAGIILLEITFECIPTVRQFMSLHVFDEDRLEARLQGNDCPQQIVTWYPASRKISEMRISTESIPATRYRPINKPVTIYRYLGYPIFVLQMLLKRARHLCGDSNHLSPGFRHLSRLERLFIAKGSAVDVELSMPLGCLGHLIDAVRSQAAASKKLFVGFRWGGLHEPPTERLWRQDADIWVELIGDESVIRHILGRLDVDAFALHTGKYLID